MILIDDSNKNLLNFRIDKIIGELFILKRATDLKKKKLVYSTLHLNFGPTLQTFIKKIVYIIRQRYFE